MNSSLVHITYPCIQPRNPHSPKLYNSKINMSTSATNGDHSAPTTSLREEGNQQGQGFADSPPTDSLEAAEERQSVSNPSAILPADLALALSVDLEQTLSRQTQEEQSRRPRSLSEAKDQASYYWDASTMAPLNALSAVSIGRSLLLLPSRRARDLFFPTTFICCVLLPMYLYNISRLPVNPR